VVVNLRGGKFSSSLRLRKTMKVGDLVEIQPSYLPNTNPACYLLGKPKIGDPHTAVNRAGTQYFKSSVYVQLTNLKITVLTERSRYEMFPNV
jgi:hypothetical protein